MFNDKYVQHKFVVIPRKMIKMSFLMKRYPFNFSDYKGVKFKIKTGSYAIASVLKETKAVIFSSPTDEEVRSVRLKAGRLLTD